MVYVILISLHGVWRHHLSLDPKGSVRVCQLLVFVPGPWGYETSFIQV